MKYDFDPNLPIYLQVMDEIKKGIFRKIYLPGNKISSVRELALKYGVNPNTIQKALSELEREGLLRSERAIGRFVTDDMDKIKNLQKEFSSAIVNTFIEQMTALGYTKEEMIAMIQ